MSYFKARCKGVEPSDPEPFCLKWLKDSQVTTCYRCGNNIHQTTDDPVSPDLCDVAICRKQACEYTPRAPAGLQLTVKPENICEGSLYRYEVLDSVPNAVKIRIKFELNLHPRLRQMIKSIISIKCNKAAVTYYAIIRHM